MKNGVAWIDDINEMTVNGDLENLPEKHPYPFIVWEKKQTNFQASVKEVINKTTARIHFHEELPFGETLYLLWGEKKFPIYPGAIVRTKWFDEKYADLDATLGAVCSKTSTTFSLWAPTATEVRLALSESYYHLNREEKGIWKLTIEGDWHGFPYQYEITVNGKKTLVNDPYAKAMMPNSEKAVIIDFSRTKQIDEISTPRPQINHLQDSIIYELHVRDATIHKNSGVKNKGKFVGLTEKSTSTTHNSSTALSYLKELGITHVQLLPINDFARVDEINPDTTYNWGYDPLYFQVPEGSYALLPGEPVSRINECKTMIESFHQEELSVILDVVYNHVFIMEESPFEKIVPGYYFRYHKDGTLSNGTGVGNDVASERQMVRKFILDTVDLWLSEYKVDGFRFDLMGCLDIETINLIQKRCLKESQPIMLLGEGWELPTALPSHKKATSINSNSLKGIRFFNDFFRDTLKGNLFDSSDTGFVNGNGHFIERLPHLLSGSVLEDYGDPFVSDVTQSVNYVECHDNHTLWDRLQLTNPFSSDKDRKRMHQLATALTLLSQGVPFIHAGQEWFRTKNGVENSYKSNDFINQLDWSKRETENDNVEFLKALIRLRKKYEVFRLKSKQEIRRRFHILETPNPIFGFTLLDDEVDFSIYANPTKRDCSLRLPSSGNWKIAVTNYLGDSDNQQTIVGEFMEIQPYEIVVLQKLRKSADLTFNSQIGSSVEN
ncbi:type I pullulanase [Oceanobacillus senegalensis]|uniref:type I pullulanase n=1 Tax=Oceanobacillus senegalensis TaxID=1936063 RepID=UPI000A30A6A0|nr:type I pullulanase [Oceanobacillus senegalensis]